MLFRSKDADELRRSRRERFHSSFSTMEFKVAIVGGILCGFMVYLALNVF